MKIQILILSLLFYSSCSTNDKKMENSHSFHFEIVEKSIDSTNCIYYIYVKSIDFEKMAKLSDSLVRVEGEYNAIVFWSEKEKIPKINVFGTIPDSVSSYLVANYTVDSYDYKYKLFYDGGPFELKNGFVADSSFFVFWRQDSIDQD